MKLFDSLATARALPWIGLLAAIDQTLADHRAGQVQTPDRQVLPLAPATTWLLMPAWFTPPVANGTLPGQTPALLPDPLRAPRLAVPAVPVPDLAAIKLITYATGNPEHGLPAILGDVLVLRASTGERLALLDGPTVTARRTAAVSLYAARMLAPLPTGPLLVLGAGVQALAHVQAFTEALGVDEIWVRGRSDLASHNFAYALQRRGLVAEAATDLDAALARCPLIVTATSAQSVCLRGRVRDDAFVAAVGAFAPTMAELDPELTRDIAKRGQVVLDSAAARHEGGDLIVAGLDCSALPTLAEQPPRRDGGPVLFKSCGWSLWDLAAARCAVSGLPAVGAAGAL